MMMNFLKNIHKNRTFFLALYLICQIFSTDFCLAKNIEERKNIYSAGLNPFWESTTNTHTKNETLLFAFWQKKISANIQNPILKVKSFFVWILFPTIIIAAFAGYLYGKRKGKKLAVVKKYPVSVTAPVVLISPILPWLP